MNFQFISGLPRSGSTLLASILAQNPANRTSIMSPVGRLVTDLHENMGGNNEAVGFLDDEARRRVLRGVFENYYGDTPEKLVFDTNRRWTANVALLGDLFPSSRIICCVRPPAQIADSFERIFQSNPLRVSVVYGSTSNLTVYERVSEIMSRQGVLGFAFNGLRTAFYGPHRHRLYLVDYENLCLHPDRTLLLMHESLGLPVFKYDFNAITPVLGAAEFDEKVQTPGLHSLRPTISWKPQHPVLPPDIYNGLPAPFWLPPAVKPAVTAAK
jgi:sulfotransferase